jgi:hypothetical protein
MPAKAKLTTRTATTTSVTTDTIPKGSGLTNAELDSNFLNLRDQSIAISNGSNSSDVTAGQTITVTGTGGISVSQSNRTVTVDGSGVSGGGADIGDFTFSGTTISSGGGGFVIDAGSAWIRMTDELDMDGNYIENLATPTASDQAVNKGYVDNFQELTGTMPGAGPTYILNRNGQGLYRANLTSSITISQIQNFSYGKSITFVFRQDATGGRTVSWTPTIIWAGGVNTLSTAANAVDVVTIFNDGVSLLGSINKDYN